jgi:hypothetical protein
MATFTWTGQTTTSPTNDLEIAADDIIGFYGATWDTAIEVGEYQTTTHVEDDENAHQCTVAHLSNTKYLGAALVDINGGGSEDVANILTSECALKINFADAASVTTTACTFWADDGATGTAVPTDITFYALEQGDAAWTNAEGSAAALTINDDEASTSHDYYIAISASPEAVGDLEAFRLQIQLTYQ